MGVSSRKNERIVIIYNLHLVTCRIAKRAGPELFHFQQSRRPFNKEINPIEVGGKSMRAVQIVLVENIDGVDVATPEIEELVKKHLRDLNLELKGLDHPSPSAMSP
jgi:hypothetical protein